MSTSPQGEVAEAIGCTIIMVTLIIVFAVLALNDAL